MLSNIQIPGYFQEQSFFLFVLHSVTSSVGGIAILLFGIKPNNIAFYFQIFYNLNKCRLLVIKDSCRKKLQTFFLYFFSDSLFTVLVHFLVWLFFSVNTSLLWTVCSCFFFSKTHIFLVVMNLFGWVGLQLVCLASCSAGESIMDKLLRSKQFHSNLIFCVFVFLSFSIALYI